MSNIWAENTNLLNSTQSALSVNSTYGLPDSTIGIVLQLHLQYHQFSSFQIM